MDCCLSFFQIKGKIWGSECVGNDEWDKWKLGISQICMDVVIMLGGFASVGSSVFVRCR